MSDDRTEGDRQARNGIVTVTVAAAIDQTYVLPRLSIGSVNRAVSAHREVSGKGVNVANAVALADVPVSGVLAIGASDLDLVAGGGNTRILHPLPVAGHTRINTTIIDDSGHTTKVNESPVPMSRAEWDDFCGLVMSEVARIDAGWLVICGSLPRVTDGDEPGGMVPIVELIDRGVSAGVRVAVDTSEAAFDLVAERLDLVALIKPNTHELADIVRRDLTTVGDVITAAQELRARGVNTVYVSMGEDGALAVAENGVWLARAEARRVVNSAGAGDASLAGFLVNATPTADGTLDIPAAIGAAASWGALAVTRSTTLLSSVDGAPVATVTPAPDPSAPLREPARYTPPRE
ncbi:1-phosphofructokinase [Okibacterium endophyticum]